MKKLASLTFLLFLVACGGSEDRKWAKRADSAPALNGEEPKLTCPSGDCPEYVAFIYGEDETSSYSCTGSLFNGNHILTNSHCLEGKTKESSCEELSIYFLSEDGVQTKYNCESVVHVNDLNGELDPLSQAYTKDYAVFKINEAPELENLDVSKTLVLEDKDPIVSYATRLERNSSQLEVKIKKLECSYSEKNFFLPGNVNHFSPFMTMNGCLVLGGNSGSPLITPSGELVGIVHASYFPFEPENRVKLENGNPSVLGYAVSVHCFDIPEFPELFNNDLCVIPTDQEIRKRRGELLSKAFEPILPLVEEAYSSVGTDDQYLDWTYDEQNLIYRPVCLKEMPLAQSIWGDNAYYLEYERAVTELVLTENLLPIYRATGSKVKSLLKVNIDEIPGTEDQFQVQVLESNNIQLTFQIPKC